MEENDLPPPPSPTPPDAPGASGARPRRGRQPGSTRVEIEKRIERAEELLAAGLSDRRAARTLAGSYGVSIAQGDRYVREVQERWLEHQRETSAYRREKVFRMTESFFQMCVTEKTRGADGTERPAVKFGPAAIALTNLARMAGGFVPRDRAREEAVADLGPPPDDARQMLVYVRKMLALELRGLIGNEQVDPEKRLRWLSELSGRLGMLYSRSEVEEQLASVESLVAGQLQPAVEVVDAKSIAPTANSRRAGRPRGPRAIPGPAPGTGAGEDGRDPSDGGGPVGSP